MRSTISTDLDKLGIQIPGKIHRNCPPATLIEDVLKYEGGKLAPNGALIIDTGKYTGRSPNDKYFVAESSSRDDIWWGPVNRSVEEQVFDELFNEVVDYYSRDGDGRGVYLFDGFCGADPKYSLPIRILARKAWQALFAHNMFIRPAAGSLREHRPEFTIINASEVVDSNWKAHGLNSETFILFNLQRRLAIIGGTEYGGEMKKGIFSVMNYILPKRDVLSMHCSANIDRDGDNPALFFGLSGTGKTTLSTDPERLLIGDDEHGWSDDGIFNFEGGCYAKVINLDATAEPDIYQAIRFGALLENVTYDEETRLLDYTDSSKTENTRVSYPLEYIRNSLSARGRLSMSDHPQVVIFLSCDAYGILPPVSRLTSDQAMYHFISGYTAKVAGTERGITEPKATFSPCFGGPFLTLHPLRYAQLLKEKLHKFKARVYLVNTGWSGGSANSSARRISIRDTRAIITALLNGDIEKASFQKDPLFNVSVPEHLPQIDSAILAPRDSWQDKDLYDETARSLVTKFYTNFQNYTAERPELVASGPNMDY